VTETEPYAYGRYMYWASILGVTILFTLLNTIFVCALCRSYKALKKLDKMKPDDRYFGVHLSLIVM
jgi:hypothetical protein